MRRIAVAILAVLMASAAQAQTVDGVYRRDGAVSDRMTVRTTADGRLAVHIETLGEAGQSCEVDELLELRGPTARFGDLENAARDWSIAFDGERATIAYAGAHPWYCGPRANFRGEWHREGSR